MRISDWSSDVCSSDLERVDFVVRQNAGPPRTLAGAIGYNTGEGAQVRGSWTHRNLFPPEGALIVDGILGTQQQGAGVTFRRSNAGRRDKTFSLIARADHSNYDAFDAFTGTLSARSEEHTSELPSLIRISYAVFCLKKKNN